MKRFLSLLLALSFLLPVTAWAEDIINLDEQDEVIIGHGEAYDINPAYQYLDIPISLDDEPEICEVAQLYEADLYSKYLTDVVTIGTNIRNGMVSREQVITVFYKSTYKIPDKLTDDDEENLKNYIKDTVRSFLDVAFTHDGKATHGDYLRYNYYKWHTKYSYIRKDGYTYFELPLDFIYMENGNQEIQTTKVIKSWKENELKWISTESDYRKIVAIYDLITSTIEYDHSSQEGLAEDSAEYLMRYSSYAAAVKKVAVCQGYASLFYRLALEYGVDCRLITGEAPGGRHAWNIVKINGKWYNLDSTWDAGHQSSSWKYFLRSSSDFGSGKTNDYHYRDDEFITSSFNTDYPTAGTKYTALGDVDGDYYDATVRDLMILQRYIAGWIGYSQYINIVTCDIDGNGGVGASDATALQRHIAGWEGYETLPVKIK